MKTLFKLALLLLFIESHAQIGINTTSPDAQLDIEATNAATPSNTDGLLIPRVNAFPAINPTAAQQGMMVYLMVTSGINTPGFYYWDNLTTSWVGISSTANGDKDWYKVGTTSAPSSIADDMFHDGKVGIGINNPLSKLHVATSSTGIVPHTSSLITLESNTTTAYMSLFSNTATGLLFGANANNQEGFMIYNHPVLPSGFVFRTNNALRFAISGTGNVGIGSTNLPEFPLHLTDFTVGDKISLFGATGPHYGFGIQSALLQMHSAGITDDIAFGYGSSATFTENMRIKGNGKVGIGLTNPLTKLHIKQNSSGMTPNTESFATIENDTNAFLNILSTFESGVVFGASGNSTNGGIIYNTWPNSLAFRTNGNQNRMTISDVGNVAIGNFKADYPLHFPSVLGDKVSLWGTGANHYGFGLQSNLLQIHSDFDFSDIAFGYGSSGAFTENVRFTGDGFVGIGENNPTVPLSFASTLGNKVSMWGNSSANYGFSVQSLALQIHTANSNGDVVFGSGNTASLTETMRIRGTGNVGIGLTNPLSKLHIKLNASGTTPNPNALATLENSNQTYFNLLSGTESGILFGTSTNATSGAIVFNQATVPNGLQFRTNNNQNRMTISDLGNIGIGDFKSDFPLQFEGVLGDKISLFGSAGNHYGFGLQSALMQIHSATSTDDIAFGYGSSASFTERMRIKGTGEVGIGTNAPTAELEVNGFTKMGTTAPAVKMLKFTGTTAAIQGNNTVILHGLTSSKILAVNVLVEYVAGSSVPPSYTASVGYEYDYFVSAAGITIWNKAGNSANILSKPFRILVTYEE